MESLRLAPKTPQIPDLQPLRPPGKQFGDIYDRLIRHPLQRRNIRRRQASGHDDGSVQRWALPPEVCEIVIDSVHNDKPALGCFSLVCRDWLIRARLHLFHNVDVGDRRAYTFLTLFKSPYSTFRNSIRKAAISDSTYWYISWYVLSQMAKANLSLQRVDLTLGHSLKEGADLSLFFGMNLVELRIECELFPLPSNSLVGTESLVSLICSFRQLQVLHISGDREANFPHVGSVHTQISLPPRLHSLSICLRGLPTSDTVPFPLEWVCEWILSQYPSPRKLSLLFIPTSRQINLVSNFLQRRGQLVNHVELGVSFFHPSDAFIPLVLTPSLLPSVQTILLKAIGLPDNGFAQPPVAISALLKLLRTPCPCELIIQASSSLKWQLLDALKSQPLYVNVIVCDESSRAVVVPAGQPERVTT